MQITCDADEGLSLLDMRDGIPTATVMDNALEKTMGVFRKKNNSEVVNQIKCYSAWQTLPRIQYVILSTELGGR